MEQGAQHSLTKNLLRVDYAQRRLNDLKASGVTLEAARDIVGAELRAGAATKITSLMPPAAKAKAHLHSEQFDGHAHSACGRGTLAVSQEVFAATPSTERCTRCERDEFQHGQPDWHAQQAKAKIAEAVALVESVLSDESDGQSASERPRP